MRRLLTVICAFFIVVGVPATSLAQTSFEVVGSRALGMGGAFVAVADDPSAVFWNPAGLSKGQPGGVTIEWVRFRFGDQEAAPAAGPWRRSAKFVSLGTWPIGLSVASFDESRVITGIDGPLASQRFSTKHYGATVLQSLTDYFVVGTTVKYVRGTVATGPITGITSDDAFDEAADRDGVSSGTIDLDLSAMFDARVFRLGWTTRNLRSPTFEGTEGPAIELKRHSRVGVAILPADGLIFAVDLDVDSADLPTGPQRMVALGAEHQFSPRFAVRGGARWNLDGTRTAIGSVGVSLALKPGAWLDGHMTRGRARGERGFGFALRAGW